MPTVILPASQKPDADVSEVLPIYEEVNRILPYSTTQVSAEFVPFSKMPKARSASRSKIAKKEIAA